MASQPRGPQAGVATIVARIPIAEAVQTVADQLRSEITAFERLSEASQAHVTEGLGQCLGQWYHWLTTGLRPTDSDFDPLRDWARARAAEGIRLEDLQQAFAVGAEIGWHLIRQYASSDEAQALLDAAGLLMQYIGWMSAAVTDLYLTERSTLVSEEERRTRSLLDGIGGDSALDASDHELAKRLNLPVDATYAPFAIVMPGRSPRRHATLAARLRNRGRSLAVTEGERVVGLTCEPLNVADLDEGHDVLMAIAEPTSRAEVADVRHEVVLLVEHGRRLGDSGRMQAEDYLLEILLLRSPGTTARLRAHVLEPLTNPENQELLHTLDALVSCRFDRAATSAALHIHRNTLAYRLRQIEEVAGLDLKRPRDLARVYLALAVANGAERH